MSKENYREIYLAGGCFWGTQMYFEAISGVVKTEVGYANGNTANPTYEEVCQGNTGHAEAIKVIFDTGKISLDKLLELFYDVIDPVSVNKQGGDIGTQYRTGIYFINDEYLLNIKESIKELQKQYDKPIAIEVKPLENYYPAEEYHQEYLKKNPSGYCHISRQQIENVRNM